MHKEFLKLAIPNILTNLVVPVSGIVDTAILGHLEDISPLAGVALGTVIFDYTYWTFGFLRMGTTGLVAHAFGRNDQKEQELLLWRSMLWSFLIGFFLILLQKPISMLAFQLLQGDASVEVSGQSYFNARIWGALPTLSLFVINGWLIGTQRVKTVLWLACLLHMLNILLDLLFILYFDMGAAGAGYATMLSSWIVFIISMIFLIKILKIKLPISFVSLIDSASFTKMFHLNVNLLIRTFILITAFALFTNISASFGTLVLSMNSIIHKIIGMIAYIVDGYAFSLESMAGKYAASGELKKLKRSLMLTLKYALITSAIFSVCLYFNDEAILSMITKHTEIIQIGREYIVHACVIICITSFAYVFDGYYIGLAKGEILKSSIAWSFVIGFFPLALYAYLIKSNMYLWLALICFSCMRSLTLFRQTFFKYEKNHL